VKVKGDGVGGGEDSALGDFDLKWYEKIERLEDFARMAEKEGWEVDFSVGPDGLPELNIRRLKRKVKSLRDLFQEFL